MKKKVIALVLVCVLVFGIAVGGTLAWLIDKTETVTNTFTVGDVAITLDETTGETYTVVPGLEVSKDPKVTVEAKSETCYVFVKVEKTENFDKYVTATVDNGWAQLDNDGSPVAGVYYREVQKNENADQVFNVLTDNKVVGTTTATKSMYDKLGKDGGDPKPVITFTAYAVQKTAATTPYAAWELAEEQSNY